MVNCLNVEKICFVYIFSEKSVKQRVTLSRNHIEGGKAILSDIKGDIKLYTSYDREKFADSEYVYNSIAP
jgi:hypothetical protein